MKISQLIKLRRNNYEKGYDKGVSIGTKIEIANTKRKVKQITKSHRKEINEIKKEYIRKIKKLKKKEEALEKLETFWRKANDQILNKANQMQSVEIVYHESMNNVIRHIGVIRQMVNEIDNIKTTINYEREKTVRKEPERITK